MKLLLFSDLHADSTATHELVQRAQSVDVLVGAGDFATVRRNLPRCIDILRLVSRPTILVAGNNETTEELQATCRGWSSAHILHGSAVTIENVTFFGIGGGIPVTPFGAWSYDFTEDQARDLLANCPAGCVLVTHSPPKGAVDQSAEGQSLGSVAIREVVQRTSPRLVVCGHIHASGGQHTFIGSTPVVNAGPAGIEWQLETPEA
jgi:Icc-related predicted phosphoesterase